MGERYLIDTSTYSYYITRRLAAEPYLFFERIVGQESLLSVVTRIELLSWIPGNKVVEAVVRSIRCSTFRGSDSANRSPSSAS